VLLFVYVSWLFSGFCVLFVGLCVCVCVFVYLSDLFQCWWIFLFYSLLFCVFLCVCFCVFICLNVCVFFVLLIFVFLILFKCITNISTKLIE